MGGKRNYPRRMMTAQLRKAEAAYRAAFARSEQLREKRNAAIRQAFAEGMPQTKIADAMELTRARLSQLVLQAHLPASERKGR